MRRDEYLALGGLDPTLSLFFNDVDLCRRLWQKGRRIRYLAEAEVMHHRGASTHSYDRRNRNLVWIRNRTAYYRKHYGPAGERWARAIVSLWGIEYGMRIRLGPRVMHLLNHPDYAMHALNSGNYDKRTRSAAFTADVTGESLLTSNGEYWQRQRRAERRLQ